MVKVSKKILKNNRKTLKFKTKKLKVKRNLKGGNINLGIELDPANDDIFQAFSNIMKMYDYDVEKEVIEDKFDNCLSLVIDLLSKVSNDPNEDYSYDSNPLLKDLANNFDNMELEQICHGLENFVVIYLRHQNISNNPKQRDILDKLYDEKMKINLEFDKDEEERETIYRQLEKIQDNKEPLIKNMVGGAATPKKKLFTVQNVMMFMGLMPFLQKVLSGTFNFNIISYVTGKELEKLREEILKEVIEDKKETNEILTGGSQQTGDADATEGDTVGTGDTDATEEDADATKGDAVATEGDTVAPGEAGVPVVAVGTGDTDATGEKVEANLENLLKELNKAKDLEIVNFNLCLSVFLMNKYVKQGDSQWEKKIERNSNILKGEAETAPEEELQSETPENKFELQLKDFNVKSVIIDIVKKLKFKGEDEVTPELEKKIKRFDEIQVDLALHMRNKQMKKYMDDLKVLLDALGIAWDLMGMTQSSSVVPKSAGDYGKVLEGDKVKFDLTEGINMFDLPAALFSLSNEEYADFLMEILPFLIAWLPKVKGFDKLLKKLKGKKKAKKIDNKKAKEQLEKTRKKAKHEHQQELKGKTKSELDTEKTNLQKREQAIGEQKDVNSKYDEKKKEFDDVKNEKTQLEKDKAELEKKKAEGNTTEIEKQIQKKQAEIDKKNEEFKTKEAEFETAQDAKIQNEKKLLSGKSDVKSPTETKKNLEIERNKLSANPELQAKLADPEIQAKLADPEIQAKLADPEIQTKIANGEDISLIEGLEDLKGIDPKGLPEYSEALRKNNKAIADFDASRLDISMTKDKLAALDKELKLRPETGISIDNLKYKDGKIDVTKLSFKQKKEFSATKKSLEKQMKEGKLGNPTPLQKKILADMTKNFDESLNSMFKSGSSGFPLLGIRFNKKTSSFNRKLSEALKPDTIAKLFDPSNIKTSFLKRDMKSQFNRIADLQMEHMTRLQQRGKIDTTQLAKFKKKMSAVKEQSLVKLELKSTTLQTPYKKKKLKRQEKLADLKVDLVKGKSDLLLNLKPDDFTELLGDLPTEMLRGIDGKLIDGLVDKIDKVDIKKLDKEGFERFKALRREQKLSIIPESNPDELLKRRKQLDLQDRIDDLDRQKTHVKLSTVKQRDFDIDEMKLKVLKGEKIDLKEYSKLTENKELQREYKDFLKRKTPGQEALLEQKMLYELDPNTKRLEDLKQAEMDFEIKKSKIPDSVDEDTFQSGIKRRIENKYGNATELKGLNPVKQAEYMELKTKQFDLDLLNDNLDGDLSLDQLKDICRNKGIDFEKAIGFPLEKKKTIIGPLSGEGLPENPAELQIFLKRKIEERRKYFTTKKTSLEELNKIGNIKKPEVLRGELVPLLQNPTKHREKIKLLEEKYKTLKLEAKHNLDPTKVKDELQKVLEGNFDSVDQTMIDSFKGYFPRDYQEMLETVESKSGKILSQLSTDIDLELDKAERILNTNTVRLHSASDSSEIAELKDLVKKNEERYKELSEKSINFSSLQTDTISDIKHSLKGNTLSSLLEGVMEDVDMDMDGLLLTASKLKEERREKQRKKGEEAFRQIIYEGIYIEDEEEEYKITESDVQDLKEKFFDLPIKGAIPQEVFSLLGGAKYVGPSNSNVKKELKKIQKVNVDLDRDLELEAMLNIKYRHNVSQKILLNKQDNLLDTFIDTYNQELSKDDLAKLKKVSEDKKLNYFRYTLQEVGDKYFNLNYSIFNLFYKAISIQLRIRSNYDIYPTKEKNFNKKYNDITNKSEELQSFIQELNIKKESQLEYYQKLTKNKILLDKNEITYELYETIKNEFEDAKQSIIDFLSINENSENTEIKQYIKEFYEIQKIKDREEELTIFNQLMEKDLNSYQDEAATKLQYYLKVENLCKEEVVYIKNEFNLVRFMNLIMKKQNKLQLFEILEEMKAFLHKLIKIMHIFNKSLTEKILFETEKEEKVIEGEKKFITQTLKNIKLEKNRLEFELKMIKREKIFELFSILKASINSELLLNKEIISRATEFINFIDFEINSIDSTDIHKKITQKFTKKDGLIQLSNSFKTKKIESNTPSVNNNLHIQKNKLTNILREIETLTKRKKLSKKNLKKLQNNRMNNIDKLVKDINNLAKKESDIVPNREINKLERNIANKRMKNLEKIKNTKKQSILKMSEMSRKYAKFNNPLQLMEQKGILTKKKNRFVLNKSLLKTKKVKITRKMNKLLKKINKNVKKFDSIKSNKSYYNN